MAGIITGNGTTSITNPGYIYQYRGVAPGSSILNLRVLDENGGGLTSNVLAALDWCLQNKDLYNIRIINLSLGHPVYESYKTDPLCQMIERCVARGIVVVTAAGNYGKDDAGNRVPGCPARIETSKTEAAKTKSMRGRQPRNYSWAQLLKRVFELDVLSCPRCGGRMRVLCAINSPPAIQKILACLGLPSRAPPIAPARPDVEEELF